MLLNGQPTKGAPAYVGVDHMASIFSLPNTRAPTSKSSQFWQTGRSGLRCFNSRISITLGRRPPPTHLRGVSRSALMRGPNGHPHQMQTDPSNQWVLGPDAAQDRIYVWKLNPGATPAPDSRCEPFATVPLGDGPRHFAFHPKGSGCTPFRRSVHHHVLDISIPRRELLRSNRSSRACRGICRVRTSLRKSGFPPTANSSTGANRTSDTIGVFSIGHDGTLTQIKPRFNARGLSKNIRHRSLRALQSRLVISVPITLLLSVLTQERADSGEDQGDHGQSKGPGSLTFTGNYTPIGSRQVWFS